MQQSSAALTSVLNGNMLDGAGVVGLWLWSAAFRKLNHCIINECLPDRIGFPDFDHGIRGGFFGFIQEDAAIDIQECGDTHVLRAMYPAWAAFVCAQGDAELFELFDGRLFPLHWNLDVVHAETGDHFTFTTQCIRRIGR